MFFLVLGLHLNGGHFKVFIDKHYVKPNSKICKIINVREYGRSNQEWTIQRNRQHMVPKTEKNKTKTKHNMRWTSLYAN